MTEKAAHGFDITYRGPVSALLDGSQPVLGGPGTILLKLERDGAEFWAAVVRVEPGEIWVAPCSIDDEPLDPKAPPYGEAFSFPISELADAKECIIGRRKMVQ
jgi:hypothetical protein